MYTMIEIFSIMDMIFCGHLKLLFIWKRKYKNIFKYSKLKKLDNIFNCLLLKSHNFY